MDNRHEIREFLATRRAKLTPDQAGLPTFGGTRRVPGLRREEVALLAGVSVEYYTKLERGSLGGVSESVLESLARALQLDDAECEHLHNLARAASARPRRKPSEAVAPSVQRLLDSMVGVPAFVRNGRLDVVAINGLGRALYSAAYGQDAANVNLARFAFLNHRSQVLYPDWVQELADSEGIEVDRLGGRLRAVSQSFVGPLAETALDRESFDGVFLDPDPVTAEDGICEADHAQTSES